jgi:peroxiredoxin
VAETSTNLHQLPPNLPAPVDDGACDHLPGSRVPSIRLVSTGGRVVDLAEAGQRPAVFFFYPRTGEPGKAAGQAWDAIPGARGCTPQSCGFRDLHHEFTKLGVAVFGVSTQETDYQREFVARNHVPFELLSDRDLLLTRALRLPTFEYSVERGEYPVERGGPATLIKRMAWFVERGSIERIWYPVFPPDRNAETVLAWLHERARVLEVGRGEVKLA